VILLLSFLNTEAFLHVLNLLLSLLDVLLHHLVFFFDLPVLIFLFFDELLLLFDSIAVKLGFFLELTLLFSLLLSPLLSVLDLRLDLFDVVTLVFDLLLDLSSLFDSLPVAVLDILEPLFLLFLLLLELIKLTHEPPKDDIFFELVGLLLLPFKTVNLNFQLRNRVTMLLFFFLDEVHLFIGFAHFLFELGDLINLVVRHTKSSSVVARFFEDLRDKFFTLLNKLLLSFITGFERLVDFLVLLAELLQVLALQVVVQELLELALDGLVLLLVESQGFDFFRLLLLLVVSFDVHLAVVDVVVHVCHLNI